MTCREHRELEREREDARRELEGLPAETPASSPTPATVPNSPYPPAPPVVDDAGNLTVPLNLRGGR